MIHLVGIDCAVQDKKIGLAFGALAEGWLKVRYAMPGGSGAVQQLKHWIDPRIPTLLAIDAPLGWPATLGTALVNHHAGQALPEKADLLFRRRTDCRKRLGRQPLDVGADRIARTAHRALNILAELAVELVYARFLWLGLPDSRRASGLLRFTRPRLWPPALLKFEATRISKRE